MAATARAVATTSSDILRNTTDFLTEILTRSDLRRRLFSVLRRKVPPSRHNVLRPLNHAVTTLEKFIATTSSDTPPPSSSLLLAQKLIRSYPDTAFLSFLLSLINAVSDQPIAASVHLLTIFQTDPALARVELAPSLFEELFLLHFMPVHQWLNEQRSKILSSSQQHSFDNEDYSICDDVSVIVPSNKSLSKMSGDQASELKDLERRYEEVVDENSRVLARYFIEVLENSDNSREICPPPSLIFNKLGNLEDLGSSEYEKFEVENNLELSNGRYNPIWSEAGRSVDFSINGTSCSISGSKPSSPVFYPQRVPPHVLRKQNSKPITLSFKLKSDSEPETISDDSSIESSSSDCEPDGEEANRNVALLQPRSIQALNQKQLISLNSSRSPDYRPMADIDNLSGGVKQTPPKDFVCPITSQIFDDPVTLETGQTYERRAIQEWIDRGNSTCPITRQELQSTQLPKTNYVLKRLIASWQEKNPGSVSPQPESWQVEAKSEPVRKPVLAPATSPNSVISQATMDRSLNDLRHAIENLCMSEVLKESEVAVLQIEWFWKDSFILPDIQTILSKPPVINGFVEILFNSIDRNVLRATVFLLSELGSRDATVIQTLTRVDSDVECIVVLFKKGLLEAAVLIYLLKPSISILEEMDMVETFLAVISKKDEEFATMCLKPKSAAILMLRQILWSESDDLVSSAVSKIVSSKVIDSIIGSLEAESAEERMAVVGMLLKCMQKEGKCRKNIADKAELAPVLESFQKASEGQKFEIINFFSELVRLNRRTYNEQVLHIIKDGGSFSTMHSLLVYLQTANQEQSPIVSGLILQLDLLAQPRKMSIYREEAIDTFISCLRNSDSPSAQIATAEMIVSLSGRFTASGKSLTQEFLLKQAGLDRSYRNLTRTEQLHKTLAEVEDPSDEEKLAGAWERNMAFALVTHEFGLLFEALAEGLKSRYAELCSACFTAAVWLIHMLSVLPETGIRGAARNCLLKRLVSIMKSAKDIEDKALALLAVKSFMQESEGLREVQSHMKEIVRNLKELKGSSPLALETLKLLSEGQESSAELWNHKEIAQVDCRENGEVLSVTFFKDKFFSGHSDGTIKVWTGRGSILHLVQEVREHTKAVTSLSILQSGERLYSGSLDKTAREWSLGEETIECIQVHDMKDQVHNLLVANSISCFIPQGYGVKVHSWNGKSKILNQSKYIKSLALEHGRLYCGCYDNSIQELDLATGTLSTIQTGSRKLLGKSNPINALHVRNGMIYSASAPLDGAGVKIWSTSSYAMAGSLATLSDVRSMVTSSELIYLGCKGGTVEIWDQKRHTRIEILQTCTIGKVLSMALDEDEEVLVMGTSDGKIQAWTLNA